MLQRCFTVLGALLVVTSCGGGATPASGPTATSVAVQGGDLPKGMARCDLSGDVDSFLAKEKAQDPNTYSSSKTGWDDLKKNGATAAYMAFYSDAQSHCAAIKTSGADIGSANYKLVVNFVIQFKDEATAAKAYTSEPIFGFSTSQLKSAGVGVIEGSQTGLTANSMVLSASAGAQSYYIAVWQKKAFVVILAVLNVDSAASKKVATSENGRIS